MGEYDGATAWVVRCLTLTFDNSEAEHSRLTEAARTAVREDMGTPFDDRDRVEEDWRTGRDRDDYVRVVGSAVADQITEIMDEATEGVPEHIRSMISDILDLGASDTKDALGEHYLPESVDDVFPEGDE